MSKLLFFLCIVKVVSSQMQVASVEDNQQIDYAKYVPSNNYPQNYQQQIIYVPYFVPIYYPFYPCYGSGSVNNGNPSLTEVTTTESPEYSFDIRKTL